jgi:hypothetical protein
MKGCKNYKMKHPNKEFEKFDLTMRELMKVPHSEIKLKLDKEKTEKRKKKGKHA